MNNEQKQRALQILRRFEQADPMTLQVDNAAVDMAALLQELIDAPEPEPVAYQVRNGWVNIALYERQIDAENYAKDQQKRHDLSGSLAHFCVVPLYTAPPAPSVPDGWLEILEAVLREMPARKGVNGNAPGHGHRITGIWDDDNGPLSGKPCAWCMTWNKAKAMLAEQQPEQPADLVRDAERGQKMMELLDIGAVDGARIATEQVDMAIEHDKKGGA